MKHYGGKFEKLEEKHVNRGFFCFFFNSCFPRLQGFDVSSSNLTESTFFFVFLFFLVLRRVEENQLYERIHVANRGWCSKWNSMIPFKLKPKTVSLRVTVGVSSRMTDSYVYLIWTVELHSVVFLAETKQTRLCSRCSD